MAVAGFFLSIGGGALCGISLARRDWLSAVAGALIGMAGSIMEMAF